MTPRERSRTDFIASFCGAVCMPYGAFLYSVGGWSLTLFSTLGVLIVTFVGLVVRTVREIKRESEQDPS